MDEEQQLRQLVQNIKDGLQKTIELDKTTDGSVFLPIEIIVDGKSTTFILGGPQADGLFKFVEHVADENWYDITIN